MMTNPYTVRVRYYQSLVGLWPKDEEVTNWPTGNGGQGWMIAGDTNYLDSPPYRLTGPEFIDKMDKRRTSVSMGTDLADDQISVGIRTGDKVHPVHVDFAKQGFIDGQEQSDYSIDYNMYYWKCDTNVLSYGFPAPILKGFKNVDVDKSKNANKKNQEIFRNTANGEKPYVNDRPAGKEISYVEDKFGADNRTNGYVKFSYSRNKYNLYLNDDPSVSKEAHQYTGAYKREVFYDRPLTALNLDTEVVPARPVNVPENYVFKGWALDAAGENLVKDGRETMPNYDLTLYAKWGEPDYIWNVTFDPNGGTINDSTEKIEQEVKHRDTVTLPSEPVRKGYKFGGWELVLAEWDKDGNLKKDAEGKVLEDTWYKDKYGVPALYADGNEVVENLYLRAIWIDLKETTATVNHHYYDENGVEISEEQVSEQISGLKVGSYYTVSSKSNDEWMLRNDDTFDRDNNAHYQTKEILENGATVFDFHYRQFRHREYTIHYVDQNDEEIISSELVKNGNRDYDARSYRDIPGYKLISEPNVELNFILDENTGKMTRIDTFGSSGKDIISDNTSITFKYQDIRIIKRDSSTSATPDGYHRIVFKAEEGGNLGKDDQGNPITEIVYDVIDGLQFDKLPVVNEMADPTHEFDKWTNKEFLNTGTLVTEDRTFTAKFVPKSKGKEKIVPKGATPTAEDLVDNYEELKKNGATFSFTPVDTSTTGEKKVEITINHPGSSKATTTTATVKVVPIVEEVTDPNEEVPEYYKLVTFDSTDAGKISGTENTTKVYKVYEGTDWKTAKYEGLNIPAAEYNDTTKTFTDWENMPGDDDTISGNITITANYGDVPVVIPFNPNDPDDPHIARPDERYARVSFVPGDGINLTDVKYYWVKKDAGITLGNENLTKPNVNAETGYESKGWDKTDDTPITGDIVVTAKSSPIADVVEAKNGAKPSGYNTVTFVSGENGNITEKTYYVNPNKYVTLTPPADGDITPDTGYKFGSWTDDPKVPRQYTSETTTITGNFNQIDSVIPATNNDGTANNKPDGYKEVTFVIGNADGGTIGENETVTFYVDPNRAVSLTAPKTNANVGYKPVEWTGEFTNKTFTDDTTITGNFASFDDIIPAKGTDGTENAKPDGYVEVRLYSGEGGVFEEENLNTVFYVNPKKNKTVGDIFDQFGGTIKPHIGNEFENVWENGDKAIDGTEMSIDVTAKYNTIDNVIPATKNDGTPNEKPEGYVEVTFDTTADGSITGGTETTKKVYVNPNVPVSLKDFAPDVTPATGKDFANWGDSIDKKVLYENDTTITAKYNDLDNISTTPKPGYVKVTLKPGDGGAFADGETTEYWIKPGVAVNIPTPDVNESIGQKFTDWDNPTTVTATEGQDEIVITAKYTKLDDIIPGDQQRPKGYTKLEFVPDENGNLSGTTVYWVNATALDQGRIDNLANGISKNPHVGYTEGAWKPVPQSPDIDGIQIKHVFNKLDDVIPVRDGAERPAGYVTVIFKADENGTLVDGDKMYYVNPLAGIKPGSDKLPIPTPQADENCHFDKWYETIDENTAITGDKTYVAKFLADTVTLTYLAEDATEGQGSIPEPRTVEYGQSIDLANARELKKENASFIGWKIGPDKDNLGDKIYNPGDSITLNSNMVAVAQWESTVSDVSYVFESQDNTMTLPDDVMDQKPVDDKNISIGETATPSKTEFTDVTVTEGTQGTWIFRGWNPQSLTVNKDKANNVFTGTWEFVPREQIKYVFNYVFKNGDEESNQQPFAITETLVPEETKYADETYTKPDYETEYPDTIDDVPGKWHFNGWTKGTSEIKGEEHWIGTWIFVSNDQITVSYEFKFVDEDGTEIPIPLDFIMNPPEVKQIFKSQTAEVPTEDYKSVETSKGTYTFQDWEPSANQENVQADVKFVGTWKFVRFDKEKYKATADGIKKEYGKKTTPQEIIDNIKIDGYTGNKDDIIFDVDESKIPNGTQNGVFKVPVKITYPDNTESNIIVTVTVGDKPLTDAERYEPETENVYGEVGEHITKDDIFNHIDVPDYPRGYDDWRLEIDEDDLPDGSQRGHFEVPVVVKYPDGTSDTVYVKVIIGERDVDDRYDRDEKNYIPLEFVFGPRTPVAEKETIVLETGMHIAYMHGYPDGTVRPEGNMTRAEAAAVVIRLESLNYTDMTPLAFADTDPNGWYNGYLNTAVKMGMLLPDGENLRPDDPITRAELAKMISVVDKQNDKIAPFEDIKGHKFEKEIDQIYGNMRIEGYEDGTFKPDKNITRAEVATILNRMYDRAVDHPGKTEVESEIRYFSDLDSGAWYYYEILEATNTHEYQRRYQNDKKTNDDRRIENWNDILEINF